MLGSDKGIKLGSNDGKVIVTIFGNLDRIKLGIDVGIELGSLDGYFDGSNDGKLEGLLIGDSPVTTDDKLLGYYEEVWLYLYFNNSLSPLVKLCWYRHVRCLFFCSDIIVPNKYYCDRRSFY